MYDPEKWRQYAMRVKKLQPRLKQRFANTYLLIHVETGKLAFGTVDDGQGGYMSAFQQHERLHGTVYGEYFGIRL